MVTEPFEMEAPVVGVAGDRSRVSWAVDNPIGSFGVDGWHTPVELEVALLDTEAAELAFLRMPEQFVDASPPSAPL